MATSEDATGTTATILPRTSCPDATLVARFVERQLRAEHAAGVEAHIDGCARCRRLLSELARGRVASGSRADTVRHAATRATPPDFRLPEVDGDHYIDRVEIARGGMGRVLSARDRRLERTVAIKEMLGDSPELRARFEREALLTARLQHPSIVSIHEAGCWHSGAPFYAMKLVPGRSLDHVVAETTTLDERLVLLPHVLAVADALAYAHEHRTIHRDLKPQNVIVGNFGETVVIDWRLAKDLDDAEPEATPDRHVADVAMTAAGEIIGTPAYMPPEQALGLAVDERADVYAMGALLYHVLAGEPPYLGNTSLEVLDAVKQRAPTPLEARQPGVPRDLIAIVTRAMARDPASRYPNAHELAGDLRRFQSGQLVSTHRYSVPQLVRRWLRRHRTAIAVAGIAMLVMIIGGIAGVTRIVREQHRAESERVLAEQHRRDAEELMDFMLGDLRSKLEPINKLALLDTVARKAMDHYRRRHDAVGEADQRKAALARQSLGEVLAARGDLRAALAEFVDALMMQQIVALRDPANATVQRELATSHDRIGQVVDNQGKSTLALSWYRRALAIRESLSARDRDVQLELATSHERIAEVLQDRGDSKAALTEFNLRFAILGKLAAGDRTVAVQTAFARSHAELGYLLQLQGDAAAALTHYRAGLLALDKVVSEDPTNALLQRDVSVIHQRVAMALVAQGETSAALDEYRVALTIDERLAADDPTNAARQDDLWIGHMKLGSLLEARADHVAALAELRAGAAIVERQRARDPNSAEWQHKLSVTHQMLGDTSRARGDLPAALTDYRAALGISEALVAKAPDNAIWQRDRVVDHAGIGNVLLAMHDTDAAVAEYRAGLAIAQTLASRNPSNVAEQRNLSVVYTKLGRALKAHGDTAAALVQFRASLAITEHIAATDASSASQRDLLVDRLHVGTSLVASDVTAALRELRAAQALAETLVAAHPDDAQSLDDLASCHLDIADALAITRDRAGARAEYRSGEAIEAKLVALAPANATYRADLAEVRAKLRKL